VESELAAWNKARGLLLRLCPARGGGYAGDRIASSSPRSSASALMGFHYSYAQAPARGGGDDGDRFTSSLFILSVSARNEARGTCVSELWCEDVDTPATVSRCASQPRLSSKHVGFRHYFEASVLFLYLWNVKT
jgi:hypothetical protein